jgi:hypothetical protein
MENLHKHDNPPAHEADRLAVEIEKDASLIKKFGYKGSFVVLFTALFMLIVVILYGVLSFANKGPVALQSQNADAAFSWTNRGAPTTISGYKTTPATPVPQTNPSICPVATVRLSNTRLAVGQTATVSAPAGWDQIGARSPQDKCSGWFAGQESQALFYNHLSLLEPHDSSN